jgi:dephospho-CoA kinase
MRIIGITGGVGSGKSAILAHIANKQKCQAIIADEVAHGLIEPDNTCYQAIVDLLGQSILDSAGRIVREKMAEMIFGDESLLAGVNQIIHPAVKDYIVSAIAAEKEKGELDFLFIEAALLLEDGYIEIVDELWYIYADEATRRERLMKRRGYSAEKAQAIIRSQLPDSEFRAKCQVIIDNNHDIETAMEEIERSIRSIP